MKNPKAPDKAKRVYVLCIVSAGCRPPVRLQSSTAFSSFTSRGFALVATRTFETQKFGHLKIHTRSTKKPFRTTLPKN